MKFITAIIKPFKLDEVREELTKVGIQGITVSEVRGTGAQKGHRELYRGAEYEVDFVPKIKLEIGVKDEMAEQVVQCILDTANTGKVGDGKIFVTGVDRVVRIRTGENNDEAL